MTEPVGKAEDFATLLGAPANPQRAADLEPPADPEAATKPEPGDTAKAEDPLITSLQQKDWAKAFVDLLHPPKEES